MNVMTPIWNSVVAMLGYPIGYDFTADPPSKWPLNFPRTIGAQGNTNNKEGSES